MLIQYHVGTMGNLQTKAAFRLGVRYRGNDGKLYSYVQFREAVDKGDVVRDATHADLTSSTANNVEVLATSDEAVGSKKLEATGVFTADVRGATGYIMKGVGAGQQFVITEKISDDEVRVDVLTGAGGAVRTGNEQGWQTAIDTTSEFQLSMPGAAFQADGVNDAVRGVAIFDVSSDDVGKHGWVAQTGYWPVNMDHAGTNISYGGDVVVRNSGNVHGSSTANVRSIGRSAATDPGFSTGVASIPVYLDIRNPAFSPREQREFEPHTISHDIGTRP